MMMMMMMNGLIEEDKQYLCLIETEMQIRDTHWHAA